MKRSIQAALLIAGALGVYQVAMAASGSSLPSTTSTIGSMSPSEQAKGSYNNGISHRDKAKKAEADMATAKEGDRVKLQNKAKDEFGKALKDFTRAAQLNPDLFQAYNGMGYSYRKLGDYTKALEYYDKALQMSPGFTDATEYRGEAYLGLNRVGEAKRAYIVLLANDREQATILLTAMKTWVDQRHADAAGVDPATISDLEKWVNERSETAKLTASMAVSGSHPTW